MFYSYSNLSNTQNHLARVFLITATWGEATASKPAGGIAVRVRAPLAHAGKMSSVSVGGTAWKGFDAATETVMFSAEQLAGSLLTVGLQTIVVRFDASAAAPLRRAKIV